MVSISLAKFAVTTPDHITVRLDSFSAGYNTMTRSTSPSMQQTTHEWAESIKSGEENKVGRYKRTLKESNFKFSFFL